MGTRNAMDDSTAIDSANRTRDAAIERLANEDATTTTGDDTAISGEPVEVGRRATTPQRRDTSGLDLGDSIFGDLDESFDLGIAPPSVRSDNSSRFGGSSHIKPRSRSRQSSIIGRNDPPIRPSSRGGATPLMSSSFNIGAFRRRAREPSILGTDRKTRPDVTTTTAADTELSSSDEEEVFAPDAESTPVNTNRRRTRASLQKDGADIANPELPVLSGSRKRKSDGLPETTDSRPEKATRTEEEPPEMEVPSDSDSESDLSSLPSPRAILASHIERPVTPVRESWAAPPASSGSEDEGDFWPDIHGLARRRRRPSVTDPLRGDVASDVSSPPSLTHSPNFGQQGAKNKSSSKKDHGRSRARNPSSPPPLMTADLANLLPKRRQKKRGRQDLEYDASGLGREDDELSFLDARSTRRKQKDGGPAANTKSTSSSRAAVQSAKEGQQPPHTRSTRSSSRLAQTYSRRSSNKENEGVDEGDDDEDEDETGEQSLFQPLADDTFEGTGGIDASTAAGAPAQYTSAGELKDAVRKFAEVDRWELSFEEEEEPELLAVAGA